MDKPEFRLQNIKEQLSEAKNADVGIGHFFNYDDIEGLVNLVDSQSSEIENLNQIIDEWEE